MRKKMADKRRRRTVSWQQLAKTAGEPRTRTNVVVGAGGRRRDNVTVPSPGYKVRSRRNSGGRVTG